MEKFFLQHRFGRGRLTVCTYASELDEKTRQYELSRLLLRDVRSSEGRFLPAGFDLRNFYRDAAAQRLRCLSLADTAIAHEGADELFAL